MATPRVLRSPPIAEALIDLRASIAQSADVFGDFAKQFASDYPDQKTKQAMRAEIKIDHGKLEGPVAHSLGFQGVQLSSTDGTAVVQFGPEGFTFNNVGQYMGGDRLIDEALRLWSLFERSMQPQRVTRIAMRYINQLDLPLKKGDEFEKYLAAAPVLPEEAPQAVSEFLARVVARDIATDTRVIVTQSLTQPEDALPRVAIDVDTFRIGDFPVDAVELREILQSLRGLKNRTFFSLLTEDAVRLFE